LAREITIEVYVPATDHWSVLTNEDGLVSGWRHPTASLHGQLYALDCPDGCKLRVYDDLTDSWTQSADSKAHLGSSKDVAAVALLPLAGKLCIVRNNMSMSIADVSSSPAFPLLSGCKKEPYMWETIAGRGQLKSFVSDLWSKFSRIGKKSHILHCQVLQA
jgi:hypothetical protein